MQKRNFASGALREVGCTMGETNHFPPSAPDGGFGDDPLLRMQFHDPRESTSTTMTGSSLSNTGQLLAGKTTLARLFRARQKQNAASSSSPENNAAAAAASAADEQPPAKKRPKLNPSAGARTSLTTPPTQQRNTKNANNASTLFHQSCRLFPKCVAVIQSSLEMEPEAACTRAPSARPGTTASFLVGDGKEPYSLPINILLHHDASVDVIHHVATQAPKALVMKDGRDDCCSLIVALRLGGGGTSRIPEDTDPQKNNSRCQEKHPFKSIPEELLAANPEAAQFPDKRRNFPLHVAAYVGASFDVINALYYAYPEALMETNFYGETPLDIVIRNGKCSDKTTNFLHDKMDHLKAARLRNRANKS